MHETHEWVGSRLFALVALPACVCVVCVASSARSRICINNAGFADLQFALGGFAVTKFRLITNVARGEILIALKDL